VLDALRTNFNLRYRSDDTLDTRMTGTFGGSLPRVARARPGRIRFCHQITAQDIDVLVIRQSQPTVKAVAAPIPARAFKKLPAPVMTAAEANRYERGLAR
jgi:hypothetical protein